MKPKIVRVALLGTGAMANVHATKLRAIPDCELVAAADVDLARASEFAEKHGIPAAFGSTEEMLKKSACDAVAIVTPDAFHTPLALACLKAGKHVLCEKPLALNYPDAKRMVAAARRTGAVNMVNFSYRDWPAIQAVAAIVRRGGIGDVRHVEASYLQAWLASKIWGDWRTSPTWLWRLSSKHGSKGVLGDVGVHIVDFATFPVGAIASVQCRLKTFPKAAGNRIGEYRLDANDSAVLSVEFQNGALGTIHTTRWCGGHANRLFLKIAGTKGTVEIDSDRATDAYRICAGKDLNKALWRDVCVSGVPNNHERFVRAIRTGRQDQPDFARGAEIQKVLDACFVSDAEKRLVSL